MYDKLRDATESALRSVVDVRFFQTERGFHGRFYCALQARLDRLGLIANGAILEMEYQKSARHNLGQRPDIIFHIPTEHSGAGVKDNNYAVWALKHKTNVADAKEDFQKLDQMFDDLHYAFGFFININATNPMREYYEGTYSHRLAAVAVYLDGDHFRTNWAPINTEIENNSSKPTPLRERIDES